MTYSQRCVFTTLAGRYERLNEQPVARDSDVPFICLTDDPELRSDTWQLRLVEPTFRSDPIRSQRDWKIRPQQHLPEFERSLYIDNSVLLTLPPEQLFEAVPASSALALSRHSFREQLIDEFLVVAESGLDDAGRVFEQLNHYLLRVPEVLEAAPYWAGLMVRDHKHEGLRRAQERWYAHVLRYSRRDQLSLNVALQEVGLTPYDLRLDNHLSPYHRWPVVSGRDRSGARSPVTTLVPAQARLRAAELRASRYASRVAELERETKLLTSRQATRMAELELALERHRHRSQTLLGSRWWRLTAPGRAAVERLRHGSSAIRRLLRPPVPGVSYPRLWFAYFDLRYRLVRRRRGPRRLVVGPDELRLNYALWKVARLLGVEVVSWDGGTAPLAVRHEDTTFKSDDRAPEAKKVVNAGCNDISKRRVERASLAVFGYGLALDPLRHQGTMVAKSDLNSLKTAKLIEGPITVADPDLVYQRALDNEIRPGVAEVWRVAIVGPSVPFVISKRYAKAERFGSFHGRSRMVAPSSEFSSTELQGLVGLAAEMGLEFGEMDVIRHRGDGRVYVIDVNDTPFSPPSGLAVIESLRAMHRLAFAFEREWGHLLDATERGPAD